MIAFLKGILVEKRPTDVIIDCGGIGYFVKISLNTFPKIGEIGERVKLNTYLQVREDAQVLFGFWEMNEKLVFEQLISVSGVGTNTALMILSGLSAEDLYAAIRSEDVNTLKRLKGVGPKTAARIVLELKDKIQLDDATPLPDVQVVGGSRALKEEALAALTTLGLSRNMAEKRIAKVLKSQPDAKVEDLIRLALKN